MTKRFTTLSAAAVLSLGALTTSAIAGEAGAVDGTKTVGAMTFESRGRATNFADVQRQGGFVTPASVRWTTTPAETASVGAVDNAGSVGALALETRGLATSFAEVRRQGGATTAGKVRWMSMPAAE